MAIYDKYSGFPWQSTSSTLIIGTANSVTFEFTNNSVLQNLKENEEYYLTPRYIRDMFISLWDSSTFTHTFASGSNVEYIGVDSGLADDLSQKPNRDLEINKILIGKRSYSGTYSYSDTHDIMSNSLISSDVDIFFYNTKIDSEYQKSTKIAFLSGTNPALFNNAPYLRSQVINSIGGTASMSFDIVNFNSYGNINIYSQGIDYFGNDLNVGGNVSMNNIVFPTIATSSLTPTNNKILVSKQVSGSTELEWASIKFPQTDYIGITGSNLNIFGSPVNANSHPLEFIDKRPMTISIGDLKPGTKFESTSIADVLRRIIYPYLAPECTLKLLNSSRYVEVGSYPSIQLEYSITKRTSSTLPTKLTNMIPSTYPAITILGQTTVTGRARGVVITPVTATSSTFTIKVSDGQNTNTASTSIEGIYPYFYGFTSSNTLSMSSIQSMNKLVEPKGDKTIDLTGEGNFFFAYDADYGPLTSIIDQYDLDIFATFSSTTKILSSPTGLWTSKEYLIYKWSNVSKIGPPSENFDFKY